MIALTKLFDKWQKILITGKSFGGITMIMKNSIKVSITTILYLILFFTYQALASEAIEERVDGFTVTTPAAESIEKTDQQTSSPFSPEVEKFIEGTELVKAAGLPDLNESVEALKAYLEETEKVKQSIKKRFFDEPIDTKGLSIETWLGESANRLLFVKEKYPESRHLSEGLGRIYREMYFHTQNKEYLEKAADAFIQAEELGVEHAIEGNPFKGMHYVDEMTEVLSILGDRRRVDKYFSRLITPTPTYAYFNYAEVLSKLDDPKAEEFFEKVIAIRREGNFDPVIKYTEYLLDRGKNNKALTVLQQLKPSEEYAYTYFLKGVVLEKMGKVKDAEKAYKRYQEFQEVKDGLFTPPTKYRIPNSKLQRNFFRLVEKTSSLTTDTISAADIRSTSMYCSSSDWACKARYYAVWTINKEAQAAGSFGPGTVGMMRAVGWNIRTRVFVLYGTICGETCFHNAPGITLTSGDVNSVYRRYWYVIETGVYAGLPKGVYTSESEKVFYDVFYGRVPDPIVGKCLYGLMSGDKCNGTCTSSGIWDSFWASQSGQTFRAGKLEWYRQPNWPWDGCYRFVPMSTPTGSYCGINCWADKGVICPVEKKLDYYPYWQCDRSSGFYYYYGPVYGNFFWRFNR